MSNDKVKLSRTQKWSSNSFVESLKENSGVLIGFLIICIILSVSSEVFLTQRNIFNVLRQLANNLFLSCGMFMVILLGGIDLSVGSNMAVSGVLCAGFISYNLLPAPVAIVLALLCGLAIGLINATIISFTNIPPFIVTLATMNIGRGFARLYTSSKTIPVNNDLFGGIGTGNIFGVVPMQVIYIIIILIMTSLILGRSKLGRHIYATGDNRTAAMFSGINTTKVTFFVFMYSALMSSFAGIVLASRMFAGTATAGEGAEMDAIAAVVLGGTSMSGGVGKLSGVVIGVFLIAVLNNGMNLLNIDSSWQFIVKGIVILIAVYIDYLKKTRDK